MIQDEEERELMFADPDSENDNEVRSLASSEMEMADLEDEERDSRQMLYYPINRKQFKRLRKNNKKINKINKKTLKKIKKNNKKLIRNQMTWIG